MLVCYQNIVCMLLIIFGHIYCYIYAVPFCS